MTAWVWRTVAGASGPPSSPPLAQLYVERVQPVGPEPVQRNLAGFSGGPPGSRSRHLGIKSPGQIVAAGSFLSHHVAKWLVQATTARAPEMSWNEVRRSATPLLVPRLSVIDGEVPNPGSDQIDQIGSFAWASTPQNQNGITSGDPFFRSGERRRAFPHVWTPPRFVRRRRLTEHERWERPRIVNGVNSDSGRATYALQGSGCRLRQCCRS